MSKPILTARFHLNDDGKPEFVERDGLKHYVIDLRVDDAPEDTYAVNYQLHESYYDPRRESRERGDHFVQELTSFGDYTVQAKVRAPGSIGTIATTLSRALARGHESDLTGPIVAALQDIEEN